MINNFSSFVCIDVSATG